MGAIVGAEVFLYLQYSFCKGDNCTDDATDAQKNAGLQVRSINDIFILELM